MRRSAGGPISSSTPAAVSRMPLNRSAASSTAYSARRAGSKRAMREIVLDTETTGLDPGAGHRVVEVGMLELVNHIPSGQHFHCYINPQRDMPAEAFAVHGLSGEFLRDKPAFAAMVDQFLAFIEDAPLIIHNAAFDMGFINAELA